MMSPLKIRPATESDCPALTELALTSKAFWGYPDDFMHACEAVLTVTPRMIADWDSGVIEDGGEVAGFYFLSLEPGEAELQLLYVSPLAMGKGYGRALIRAAAEKAALLGHDTLRIEADPNAVGFYRRMGAKQTGWCRSEVEDARELPLLMLNLKSR
ncbi:MAG: GNAT family N-acetyltransferase [Sneathiella sp.]|nr:GNAT family N-acetyltransferase [Sneathiella sp.]